MIKKFLIKLGIATFSLCILCSAGIIVNATTVDDVAAVARQYGLPESVIQQGYNEYYANPDDYASEDFDYAIGYINQYHQEILNRFTSTTTSSTGNKQETTTETIVPSQSTEATSPNLDTSIPSGSNSGSSSGSTGNSSSSSGSSSSITESDFINMTIEEKQNYVSSLPEDQQENFLNNLSADELKSIVKQLPTDDKAAVADTFIQAGEALGVRVTVDEITDDSISMIMKNKDGELIDVATVGVIVEDTGYDYRKIFSVSALMVLAAIGGLWFVVRKCFNTKSTEAENEQ